MSDRKTIIVFRNGVFDSAFSDRHDQQLILVDFNDDQTDDGISGELFPYPLSQTPNDVIAAIDNYCEQCDRQSEKYNL